MQHVVDLDADLPRAAELAGALRDWLVATGVVVVNERRDTRQPSELVPGPHAARAAPITDADRPRVNQGIDIVVTRAVWHTAGNMTPAPCPTCGIPADLAAQLALIDTWLAGPEPDDTCARCGATHPLGDWRHDFGFVVGNLALTVNNWPPLHPAFVAEVGRRWAPDRWAHLHGRW